MQPTRDPSLPGADDIRAAIILASDGPTQKSSALRKPRSHEIGLRRILAINRVLEGLAGTSGDQTEFPGPAKAQGFRLPNAARDRNSPITATR
jgi:hypothetical protein